MLSSCVRRKAAAADIRGQKSERLGLFCPITSLTSPPTTEQRRHTVLVLVFSHTYCPDTSAFILCPRSSYSACCFKSTSKRKRLSYFSVLGSVTTQDAQMYCAQMHKHRQIGVEDISSLTHPMMKKEHLGNFKSIFK